METKKGIVIGQGVKSGRFCWFVRHADVEGGKPMVVDAGDLEYVVKRLVKKVKQKK